MTKTNLHTTDNWVIIAVIPAPPDWVNIYYNEHSYWAYDVPALLLQECTTETQVWTETDSAGETHVKMRTRECDREVRSVFADVDEFGQIDAADRTSNYHRSMSRSDYARYYEGKTPGEDGYPAKEGTPA